ncbi:ubiquitin carboxyl-terminal hydrolase 42-like [Ammospiza nelsoni]|uniref:ubiquitin carboxyl-terminal hydrolase 42-like n=1 Tax=Ammospiza nelsoni TaxID=2857394 RepID=UPI00286CF7EF|nr:ubiquitin carboxyl-terminal hydrolase 42-like [Ammospiza nelsoni]
MDWRQKRRPGAGLYNLGSTCYLNVILQCLTYTPPLANYLLSRQHSRYCSQQGFCMMCIMEDHVRKVLYSSAIAIRPRAVIRDLKFTCLSCKTVFDFFKVFLDVLLKIKGASSLTTALEDFVKPKEVDGKKYFKCSKCKKKVAASKVVTVHHAPRVLTVVEYPECLDLRPYTSDPAGEPIFYSLYAVVVHTGHTCLGGHFFCYTKASNGQWYKMNDVSVDSCAIHTVLGQQAYLLFYARSSSQMEEMASSSSSSFPSVLSHGESSSQAGSASPQAVPYKFSVTSCQRNSARSRSPQWSHDHRKSFIHTTNHSSSAMRRRKRTTPPDHDNTDKDATAPGPSKRSFQLSPEYRVTGEQLLPRERRYSRPSQQGYEFSRRFAKLREYHQSESKRRKHSFGTYKHKSQS